MDQQDCAMELGKEENKMYCQNSLILWQGVNECCCGNEIENECSNLIRTL